MTQTYSVEAAGLDSLPVVKAAANQGYDAHLLRFRATVNLASQASGDTVVLSDIPAGYVFAGGEITASVSLATATVAIGNASSAGKYRAAAVYTTVDQPSLFGNTTTMAALASTAPERLILTVGVAALPASGILVVDTYFSHAN